MVQACYHSDWSGNISVAKKADIGEETQTKSGPDKSECHDDYRRLTFITFEDLRSWRGLSCDLFQGQEGTNKIILPGTVGKQ